MAINEFQQLPRYTKDTRIMEYIGYCFNLKGVSVAAIPWYEKAVENGAGSTSLYNNLGASYLEASAALSFKDRLDRSEYFLKKAIQLSPSSTAVRINILRNAVAKFNSGASYNPVVGAPHAIAALNSAPDDPFVESQVAQWYKSVCSYERDNQAIHSDSPAANLLLAARKQFDAVLESVESQRQRGAGDTPAHPDPASARRQRFFLKPI
jgi:hypothetical protein